MMRRSLLPLVIVSLLFLATGCSDQVAGPDSSTVEPEARMQPESDGPTALTSTCTVTVPDDYSSIQAAMDNTSPGAVVCVNSGIYAENVSVDKALTLQGTSDPTSSSAATIDGQLTVEESSSTSGAGATITRLKIAPSAVFDVDAGGIDPFGIRVTVSDVTITDNLVAGLTGDATGPNNSGTVHGIQVWNPGTPYVTGVTIEGNTIMNIENRGDVTAGWPQYGGAAGVKVQGVVKDITVTGNTVRGVHSAGWVYGVSLTHTNNDPQFRSPENVAITANTIHTLNDGSTYDVFVDQTSAPYPGVAIAIDDTKNPTGPGGADADQATVSQNNFLSVPIGAQNKDQVHTLVAECNYWGHASGPSSTLNNTDKGSQAIGDVDYKPWSVREIGQGVQPGNSCVGGREGMSGGAGE